MNPLQIYPKHPSAPDTYYIGGGWSPACITAVDKRFTDAELAAEYHSAWAAMLGVPIEERYSWEKTCIATLRRFAELPHYDENPA